MASNAFAHAASHQAATSRHWRKRLLAALATTSSVARAAAAAQVSPARAHDARRSEPEFARAWAAAIADGYINLELEMIRRLRDGDLTTSNGAKFDFANAIRLIAAHRDSAGRGPAAETRNVSIAEVAPRSTARSKKSNGASPGRRPRVRAVHEQASRSDDRERNRRRR